MEARQQSPLERMKKAGNPKGTRGHGNGSRGSTGAVGTLIIIGGREDKSDERLILKTVADQARSGSLVVCTAASSEAAPELWNQYEGIFKDLGVKHVEHLPIEERDGHTSDSQCKALDRAAVVFFTGGDQLRITSKIEGTPLAGKVRDLYRSGGVIAGTSAGASVMSETMLVSGPGRESYRILKDLFLAPGLGLMRNAIIDQHFAERGRIGRLLGAVAQNPRLLGIGIDEDTAIVVEKGRRFHVIGSGAVYIADGRDVTSTNISEEDPDKTMSIFNVRLHVLSQGNQYDLMSHQPTASSSLNVKGP
jgi:cyanophycinase